MARAVQECPYRVLTGEAARGERASCRLLREALAVDCRAFEVPREACEQCCRLARPAPRRPNPVVASLIYRAADRLLAVDGQPGWAVYDALRLQRAALEHMEVVSGGPTDAPAASPPPHPLAPRALIDRRVTVETFIAHLVRGEPFSHPRYADGEWLSMLGARGVNCDGHDHFPETTGRELRQSLDYVAARHPDNQTMYVGLVRSWREFDLQAYLLSRGLTHRVHWVGCMLFQNGLRDFSTKRFLETVRRLPKPKYLVANRWLAPIARWLGCRHVRIPEENCYLAIDATEKACRFRGRGLVLLCASFAAECLIRRLHQRNPAGTYVDCGHVFDAMVGRLTRRYTQANEGGIVGFVREHYAPMFDGK